MTIKSSREIDAVFRDGKRHSTPLLVALVRGTPVGRGPSGRVAFIAGKKLGPAVVRNRAKRVMREAVRRAGGPWTGTDVVLIARPGAPAASSRELDAALQTIVCRAELIA